MFSRDRTNNMHCCMAYVTKSFLLTMVSLVVALIFPLFPVTAEESVKHTCRLTQSTAAYELWTTTPADKVFKDDAVPPAPGSGVTVYAARNEFEPFQLVVRPASSGTVTVSVGDFGAGITTEIYRVKYVNITQVSDHLGRTGDYPDPLWPVSNGASEAVTGGENTAFWISVHVPESTPAGDYTMEVVVAGIAVPVKLHVFNFAVPKELHVKSQMNFSHNTILEYYGVPCCGGEYWQYVDGIKQFFMDHRLTPKSVLWSGGVTGRGAAPYIDYDCNGNLADNDGIWGFEAPAGRYLGGSGTLEGTFPGEFNGGTGFPSFMAATFQNNDSSLDQRPHTFCGETLGEGDWYTADNPDTPYNRKWFEYITGLSNYLEGAGYLSRAYYYMANEPQDQSDYDAVAWYARTLKNAAPNLQLMVSEEPRPEIFDHPEYGGGGLIDIWLPVLNNYDPSVSFERAENHGEETWIYWLHGTRPPFFNPITLDHPGIEGKLTGWFLWKYRLRGIAYYSLNNWSKNPWTNPMESGHNGDLFMLYPPSETGTPIAYGANNHLLVPSIRFELMRDSLEDYEYLLLLNGGAGPVENVTNPSDAVCEKIIKGTASYTGDSGYLYNLRRLMGLKIGGEIESIPDIEPPVAHPRSLGSPKSYHINFQDPEGEPKTTRTEDTFGSGYIHRYVSLGEDDYLQVGVSQYDTAAGFGWLDDTAHFKTGRDPWGSETDERRITYAYDDWAHHPGGFEFDLPEGGYEVEVSVGTPRKVRKRNRVVIEGTVFVDDEPSEMYIVRKKQVTVRDHKLTVEVGIWGEYTMLNYLIIEPRPNVLFDPAANLLVVEYLRFGEKAYRLTMKFDGVNSFEITDALEIEPKADSGGENPVLFDGSLLQIPELFIGEEREKSYRLELVVSSGEKPVTLFVEKAVLNP